jgi:hypothetical protein
MAIFSFHQITCETSLRSRPVIDERILASGWRDQVPNVLLYELRSIRRTNFKRIIVCTNGKFDKFDHCCDRFLDQLRNRLIIKDGFREIRIDGGAEAKQDDITEQLRIVSRWISKERLNERLMH